MGTIHWRDPVPMHYVIKMEIEMHDLYAVVEGSRLHSFTTVNFSSPSGRHLEAEVHT